MILRLSGKTEMLVSICHDEEQDAIEGVFSVLLIGKRQMLQITMSNVRVFLGIGKTDFK
jgi:hypothetical protein